jgi:8-oxo-dGTP pyrophosphatase MutT (NUDIX family)
LAWRRITARVLPVDEEGRVLLLHGWDPHRPDAPFWFTIGGAVESGETHPEAAARELREETGIAVEPEAFGEPIEASYIEFTWAGVRFEQDQTFYAILIEGAGAGGPEISFAGQDTLERATTDKHGWLWPQDLEGGTERPADPEIPRLMRLAVLAVLGQS